MFPCDDSSQVLLWHRFPIRDHGLFSTEAMVKELDFPLLDRTRLYLDAIAVPLSQPQRQDLARVIAQALTAGRVSTDDQVRSLALDWSDHQRAATRLQQPPLRRASMGYYRHGG